MSNQYVLYLIILCSLTSWAIGLVATVYTALVRCPFLWAEYGTSYQTQHYNLSISQNKYN